ncbi:unnamed protein product [Aphanomyces euteiches]
MAPLPLYDAAPRPSAPRRIAMAVAGTSNAISIDDAHAKLVAFCLTLLMAFVTVNNHKVVDATTKALVTSTMNAASAMRLASCPQVSPQDRVVMFWQSEVDGCEQVPYGVTHVVFGFAQTFEGRVNPVFQTSPDVIKRCVQLLRQRCVYSMGAVGGANNNDGMSSINDPYAFAASVKAFLDEFGFDGVDIDDETTKYQGNYDPKRVNTYMQVLHSMLKGQGNNYLISYDSYMFEGSLGCWQTSRCFAKGIENYVDWINIMAYNIDRNPDRAGYVYATATSSVFEEWGRLIPRDKIAIGICMDAACSYGIGPMQWVIQSWVEYNYGHNMGGIMIYAGSNDILKGFRTTYQILAWRRVSTTQPHTTVAPWTPPPTTLPPKTSPPVTTRGPTAPPRNAGVCGTCTNCFYPTSNGCFIGFTYLQCRAVGFTWCGE